MANVETLTKQIGKELYGLVQKESRPVIKPYWWKEKAMMWFMKEENLRSQMLRFVDVFPILKNAAEKNEHLKEYFIQGLSSPPLIFRVAEKVMRLPFGAKAVAFSTEKAIKIMAQHLIVGSSQKEITKALKKLNQKNLKYTLDLLGEATVSEAEADIYTARYLETIEILKALCQPVDLSLKLSSLYSQFDPIDSEGTALAVKERLRKILRAVKETNGTCTIDMEKYYHHQLTLKIFMEIFDEKEFEDFRTPGIAIQTYLRDLEDTLRKIIGWTKIRKGPVKIRLVKGAYWDTEVILARQKGWPIPVYTQKWETDQSFEGAIPLLLESENIILATGTHNIRSLARVMAEAEIRDIPKIKIENQFLWGMGDPLMKASIKMGYPTVAYLPCGEIVPGMGYLVRRIIENTAQTGFLFQSLGANASIEELLQDPHPPEILERRIQ